MCCGRRRSAVQIILLLVPIFTGAKQTVTSGTTNVKQYMNGGVVVGDVSVRANSSDDSTSINDASAGDNPILARGTSTHRPPHLIMILADDLGECLSQ